MPKRKAARRKMNGGNLSKLSSSDPGDGTSVTGAVMNEAGSHGATSIQNILGNPYLTTAVMICAMMFLIPMLIYSFFGKSERVLVNEILLSFMAMAMASSGITYFVLQNDNDKEMFHMMLLGISFLSACGWVYFAYNISQKTTDKEKKT
jgi:ABC-type enterochelin transport system permease subunit